MTADPATRLAEWLEQGRFRQILEWYRESLGDTAIESPAVAVLVAGAAARTGYYQLAVDLATRALSLLPDSTDDRLRFQANNVLGGVAFERGFLTDAEGHFDQAMAAARRLEDPDLLGRVTLNLASIRHRRGDGSEAEVLYGRALAHFERSRSVRGQSQAYLNQSIVAREDGRLEQASVLARRAVELAAAAGDSGLSGMALAALTEVELARGRTDIRDEIERAKALAVEAGDSLGEVEADRLRARLLLARGQSAAAARVAEAARANAKRLGALLARGECALVGAQALEAINQRLLAEARRDEAELLAELLGAAIREADRGTG